MSCDQSEDHFELTDEEKLHLLCNEFFDFPQTFLSDLLTYLENNYERTRTIVEHIVSSTNDYTPDQSVLQYEAQKQSTYVKLTPEIFARSGLDEHCFDQESWQFISNQFDRRGCLYVPRDEELSSFLDQSIIESDSVRREIEESEASSIITDTDSEVDQAWDVNSCSFDEDQLLLAQLRSLDLTTETVTNLDEIMELETVVKVSREEYVARLSSQAQHNDQDLAIRQELALEMQRKTLEEMFPGLSQSQLEHLFQLNCYNLEETIKDVEALFVSPSGYSSLDSSSVSNSQLNENAATVISSNEKTNDTNTTQTPVKSNNDHSVVQKSNSSSSSSDTQTQSVNNVVNVSVECFQNQVKKLLERRNTIHVNLVHLRQKSAHFNALKQPHTASFYRSEIARWQQELVSLSNTIVNWYVSHNFPDNVIDLHGLILKEVRVIVPEILRRKQQTILLRQSPQHRRVRLRFVTGIGWNGIGYGRIRLYLLDFMAKHNIRFEADGPGSFMMTLSSNNPIVF